MGCCESRNSKTIPPTESIKKEEPKNISKEYFVPNAFNKKKFRKTAYIDLSGLKTLDDYRRLTVIKKLKNSFDSEVCLMTRNIVRKRYVNPEKTKKENLHEYLNEVETLKHLQKCEFTPKILAFDPQNMDIYMNYIEGKPKKSFDTIKQLNEKLQILSDDYGLKRVKHYHWSNVIGTDDNIILVDFGSVPLKYQDSKNIKWIVNQNKINQNENNWKSNNA